MKTTEEVQWSTLAECPALMPTTVVGARAWLSMALRAGTGVPLEGHFPSLLRSASLSPPCLCGNSRCRTSQSFPVRRWVPPILVPPPFRGTVWSLALPSDFPCRFLRTTFQFHRGPPGCSLPVDPASLFPGVPRLDIPSSHLNWSESKCGN